MEQTSNLQAQFVQNQAPTNQQPQQAPTPFFQIQHQASPSPFVFQNNNNMPLQYPMGAQLTVPFPMQPQPQPGFNQYNAYQNPQVPMQQGPIFQHQLSLNQNPKGLVDTKQITLMDQNTTVQKIEARITSGYNWYVFLIYWELIVAVGMVTFAIWENLQTAQLVLAILSAIILIPTCVLALLAKTGFETSKQSLVFLLFILSTFLSVLTPVLALVYFRNRTYTSTECHYGYNSDCLPYSRIHNYPMNFKDAMAIIAIPLQLIVGTALIVTSRVLLRLMKEREQIVIDMKTMADNCFSIINTQI